MKTENESSDSHRQILGEFTVRVGVNPQAIRETIRAVAQEVIPFIREIVRVVIQEMAPVIARSAGQIIISLIAAIPLIDHFLRHVS